ncbi:MAG TPA: MlaD family protein [Tepidisphaeraceae bacterium]|jgi:ABC-type transporter Mla subunit MlaD|nr:MlaD family protein [Tepidisphaeraceae bacterium]
MSLYKKNLLVGVTVMVALILLGWMLLRFSDAPFRIFAKAQMPIGLEAPSAEGVSEGTSIYYLGVSVGRVVKIDRSQDLRSVWMEALIDPPVPANVEGRIRTQLFGGGASISLILVPYTADELDATSRPTSAPLSMTQNIAPRGELKAHSRVRAVFVGVDILPKEFTDLSQELRRTSEQFRESQLVPKLAGAVDTFKLNIDKAGKLIDSMNQLVGDEKAQKSINETIENFRSASQTATRIAKNLEALSEKTSVRIDEVAGNSNKLLISAQSRLDEIARLMGERLVQIAKTIEQFEAISRKINEGKGTAAMLLNDPALYENLLDVSKEMKLTVSDLRRLVEQWEQEGVPFKLGKGK